MKLRSAKMVWDTNENFNTSATQTDGNTQWQSTAGNYSDSSGNGGSFTSVVATSHSDSETDKNNGTDDAGVTTDDYNNKGSQSDAKNTSYSFDATSSVGGITAHGHGKNTANYSDTTSFTETGDYTDDPSQPEADGYSKLDQTIGYKETVIEGATQQLTGDESGGDATSSITVSGSGTYTTGASLVISSNSTVNDNVAAGTNTQSGTYGVDKSLGTSTYFQESGSYITGSGTSSNTTSANYDHTNTSTTGDDDTGSYTNPPSSGTDTLSSSFHDHTDETWASGSNDHPLYPVSWSTDSGSKMGPVSVPDNLYAQAPFDGSVTAKARAALVLVVSARMESEPDPAAESGLGIPFSDGTGPVAVVGIVGNLEVPGAKNGVGALVNNIGDKLNVDNKHRGVYGSTRGNSKSASLIAAEQVKLIRQAAHKLKDGDVYRLLLIGYSYGGAQAIDVANEIAKKLEFNDDPLVRKLWAEGRLQTHLRTIDAINPKSPPPPGYQEGQGASAVATGPNPGAVASWHNYYQHGDTGILIDFNGNLIPLQGQAIEGAANHDMTGALNTDSQLYGIGSNEYHTTIDDILKYSLYRSLGIPYGDQG